MSISHFVELNLVTGRGAATAPFKVDRRAPNHPTVRAAEPPAALHAIRGVRRFRLPGISQWPRPSWAAMAGAITAVGLIVWFVMSQRLPDIDPHEVIAENLSSAERALNDGLYVDPPERSAVRYYSTVLALDPDNADAVRGMDLIAERYIQSAKTLIQNARFADAVIALEHVRRIRPEHRRLTLLETELSKEVERHAWIEVNAPPPTRQAKSLARSAPADRAFPTSDPSAATVTEPEIEVPSAARRGATSDPVEEQAAGAVESSIFETPAVFEQPTFAALLIDPSDLAAGRGGAGVEGNTPLDHSDEASGHVREPVQSAESSPQPVAAPEPKLVRYVEPRYPRAALLRGEEGWIDVSLAVSPAGDVMDPRIEGGEQRQFFDRAALNAVRLWRYEPLPTTDPSKRIHVRLKFELED